MPKRQFEYELGDRPYLKASYEKYLEKTCDDAPLSFKDWFKGEKIEKVKKLYEELRENVFFQFSIINRDNLKKHEDELIHLHEYLPNMIRISADMDYRILEELGVWDDIIKKSCKTRHYSSEENYNELLDWIDEHKEFEDIVNKEEIKKLEKELRELEKYEKQTLDIIK